MPLKWVPGRENTYGSIFFVEVSINNDVSPVTNWGVVERALRYYATFNF